MGGMCLCRTCLFSAYLGGSSRQDALGPCERQTSSLPWPSEPWTMPIQELHCIIDGDIVMAGPRYGAVVRAASSSYAGESRSVIDCKGLPCWFVLVLCTILPCWVLATFPLGWGIATDNGVVQHPFNQGLLIARRREVGLIEVKVQDLCRQPHYMRVCLIGL